MEESVILELRPNLVNGFLPVYIGYVAKISKWASIPITIAVILSLLTINPLNPGLTLILAGVGILTLALLSLIVRIIMLGNLKYTFYKDRIEMHQQLFNIRRKSIRYSQITNITAEISVWDRICNAGDIILHSAEETEVGDLELRCIKNPYDIEKKIHELISQTQHKKSS